MLRLEAVASAVEEAQVNRVARAEAKTEQAAPGAIARHPAKASARL